MGIKIIVEKSSTVENVNNFTRLNNFSHRSANNFTNFNNTLVNDRKMPSIRNVPKGMIVA